TPIARPSGPAVIGPYSGSPHIRRSTRMLVCGKMTTSEPALGPRSGRGGRSLAVETLAIETLAVEKTMIFATSWLRPRCRKTQQDSRVSRAPIHGHYG